MAKKTTWQYKCDICGCEFPIWWVSTAEWKAGGFKKEHVCRKCFETKVPNPHYYSIDDYIKNMEETNCIDERVREYDPDLTPDEVNQVAQILRFKIRAELRKVWDK